MDPVSATITIDAPRERVYELLCDLAVRPALCDHFIEEFRLERLDPVGVGAAARFRVREPRQWMETVIEVADPPHLVRERGRGGRLNRVPSFTVWELHGAAWQGSCEATLTFWTEPTNPLDRAKELRGAKRKFRRNWTRALERLRELAESERAPDRVEVAGVARHAL